MKLSRVVLSEKLPKVSSLKTSMGASPVLVYDRVLAARVPGFRKWMRGFSVTYAVSAGEELKEAKSFARHLEKLVPLTRDFPREKLVIVAAGGGSVGDFAGFLASVLKRGVELVQMPSTWLSAIDSAHGGKTALNVGRVKNPIGTFYPASRVFIVRELLEGQPAPRAREAYGELAKIALIDGGPWVRKLSSARERDGGLVWKFLKPAIESKLRVVARDPYETLGVRAILNLGHTLGHVLEAHHGLAHGDAVAQGLVFAAEWSGQDDVVQWLASRFGIVSRSTEFKPIRRSEFLRLLRQDKKRDSRSSVRFVFLEAPGRPRVSSVSLAELVNEASRQGWIS